MRIRRIRSAALILFTGLLLAGAGAGENHRPPSPTEGEVQVYWAGPLFTAAELSSNVQIKSAVEASLQGRVRCTLPQSLMIPVVDERNIRNSDLKVLSRSDALIIWFEGAELDAGTVVEFTVAKFLDIPVVIVRTDPRREGTEGEIDRRYNLMAKNWPRTEVVVVHSIALYQTELQKLVAPGASATLEQEVTAQANLRGNIAAKISEALTKVLASKPVLSTEERARQLELLPAIAGGGFGN